MVLIDACETASSSFIKIVELILVTDDVENLKFKSLNLI